MNLSMVTAANSLSQLQHKVDSVSHNMSNVNTTGYKSSQAQFQDLLTQNIRNQPNVQAEVGRQTPYGIRAGHGVQVGQTNLHTGQGSVRETGREMDFMLEGENGWFQILHTYVDEGGNTQEEVRYTRNGSFHVQPDGENEGQHVIVNGEGEPLLGYDEAGILGPMSMDAEYDRIEVHADGTLEVYDEDMDEPMQTFTLELAHIHRPDALEASGDTTFRLPVEADELNLDDVLEPIELTDLTEEDRPFELRQGALEASNVDLTQEMSDLMASQRLMQFQSRAMTMADEMLGLSNSIRG